MSMMVNSARFGAGAISYDGPIIGEPAQYYDTTFGSAVKGVWALRKAVSGYAGSLVRIRDTNDNSEQDVGFDGSGNLGSFSVVGDAAVVKVYDQTGNGAHLEQATTTKQPLLQASQTPSGRHAIKFDGSDDFLADATNATNRPYMVGNLQLLVGVGPAGSISQYKWIASIPQSGTAHSSPFYRACLLGRSTTEFSVATNGGTITHHTPVLFSPTSGWGAIWADFSGGEFSHHAMGCRLSTFTGTSVTYPLSTGLRLGSNGDGTECFGGYLFEIAALDGSPSVQNRGNALLKLADYYLNPAARGVARRYWRSWLGERAGGSLITLAEVELKQSYAGSDETGSGTASARSEFSASFPASKAFDNSIDDSTGVWASNDATSSWLQYDFGSGVTKAITDITINSRDHASFYAECPRGGGVQSSDDGTSWTTEWLWRATDAWTQNQIKKFGIST